MPVEVVYASLCRNTVWKVTVVIYSFKIMHNFPEPFSKVKSACLNPYKLSSCFLGRMYESKPLTLHQG